MTREGERAGWGSTSRMDAARRWHAKSVASSACHTKFLLEASELSAGLRVLDLACGTGNPALDEAREVGPHGSVVGVDASEAVLELARQFAVGERIPNVEFQTADAGSLPFQNGRFDRVTSRFGAMYFPDLPRALEESRRVLRSGGKLAWLVWGPFEQPYFLATAAVAMRHAGIADPPDEARQPFCFGVGGLLRRALHDAGFEKVQETPHELLSCWPGPPEDWCELFFTGSPPFRNILDRLDSDARRRAKAEVAERLGAFYSDGEVRVPQRVILATGIRP